MSRPDLARNRPLQAWRRFLVALGLHYSFYISDFNMPKTFNIAEAARLAQQSYHADDHPALKRMITHRHKGHAQALYLKDDTLLILGSNSAVDYLRYNFRPLRAGSPKMTVKSVATAKGTSGTVWHQGFLQHAREIQDWLGVIKRRPKFIIGHSLGAATTQILSKGYKVPGIAFAAPRPCKARMGPIKSSLCLAINRTDDIVAKVPSSFQHLAQTIVLKPSKFQGVRHKMTHYVTILDAARKAGQVPKSWPK